MQQWIYLVGNWCIWKPLHEPLVMCEWVFLVVLCENLSILHRYIFALPFWMFWMNVTSSVSCRHTHTHTHTHTHSSCWSGLTNKHTDLCGASNLHYTTQLNLSFDLEKKNIFTIVSLMTGSLLFLCLVPFIGVCVWKASPVKATHSRDWKICSCDSCCLYLQYYFRNMYKCINPSK